MYKKIHLRNFFIVYALFAFLSYALIVFGLGITGFAASPFLRIGYMIGVVAFGFYIFLHNRYFFALPFIGYAGILRLIILFSVSWIFIGSFNFGLYLITDIGYFVLFIIAYIFSFTAIRLGGLEKFLDFLGYFLICVGVASVVFGVLFGSYPKNFIILTSVFLIVSWVSESHSSKIYLLLFLLLIISPDLNRAFFLQAIALFVLLMFVAGRKSSLVKMGFFIALLLLIFGVFEELIYNSFILGSQIERRYLETISIFKYGVDENISMPMMQRFYESQVVYENFKNNYLSFFFGNGFGAVIDMSRSLDISVVNSQLLGAELTHNIHFWHVAVLYRYGLFGLILYGYLFYRCVLNFKILRNPNVFMRPDLYYIFTLSNAYVFAIFIYSTTDASTFFVDPLLPLFMAVSDYLYRGINDNRDSRRIR